MQVALRNPTPRQIFLRNNTKTSFLLPSHIHSYRLGTFSTTFPTLRQRRDSRLMCSRSYCRYQSIYSETSDR
ncbi:hypothetical protein BDV38DRAFT_248811 [Aspergillus pseudotamarii]|uniref:Uncharacterized protein n=1 Tax=Aspergillus pseudotamarii TaxID=132259 RepID=A0A5N6SSY9_ASPPS|nr:uncharacterized protein BDV38DRAFT_248811 [Aspergillus pseudotamarii]KAE8136939.1 hypothetical protein BDV38DRAFT_248811 [Aspergillus pseudotamarii]